VMNESNVRSACMPTSMDCSGFRAELTQPGGRGRQLLAANPLWLEPGSCMLTSGSPVSALLAHRRTSREGRLIEPTPVARRPAGTGLHFPGET
jgi:hypothetical protein